MTVLLAQMFGAATAYPAGVWSDQVGRKLVIYLSCGLMALTFCWYLLIPLLLDGSIVPDWALGTWIQDTTHLLIIGSLVYGVAAGCYLSVDYALALDCLPEGKVRNNGLVGVGR